MSLAVGASHQLPLQVERPLETAVAVPELSIVIVNYDQWAATAHLIGQLRSSPAMRQGRAEVVVVDNHSPAHPIAARLRRMPAVSLRRWGRNHGFARAANEGCRLSRGRWFLLLNPDVTVPEGFLEDVLQLADRVQVEEPRVGIIGLGLGNRDGTVQHSSGPFPSFLGTLARLTLPRARRKYHYRPRTKRAPVPWVSGCCFLVRGDCFRDTGGFDEDFFLYYEDVDLCRRASARGWTVWHEPALRVVHHHPLHQRPVSPHLRLCTRHALLTYGAKHWPTWQNRLLAGIVRAEAWCRGKMAQRRGRLQDAAVFGQLDALAADLAHGQAKAARRRLNRVMGRQEAGHGR
jgi:N-acetylglucosaminyl-diphospho-decaprenol L-rhamnosyltransferase